MQAYHIADVDGGVAQLGDAREFTAHHFEDDIATGACVLSVEDGPENEAGVDGGNGHVWLLLGHHPQVLFGLGFTLDVGRDHAPIELGPVIFCEVGFCHDHGRTRWRR